MKRTVSLFCLLLLIFASCGKREPSVSELFAGDFRAELAGELNGVAFSADVTRQNGETAFLFYAPEALCGTHLTQKTTGEILLENGGYTWNGADFAALFRLFPTEGSFEEALLTAEGNSRVERENYYAEFLPDGTPVLLGDAGVSAKVISFDRKTV